MRIGAEFRTLTPANAFQGPGSVFQPGYRESPVTLGYRPSGFKGTVNDFMNYYHRLKEFLKNPYAAHSSLRKGGIIWRIAVMVLQDTYPWDEVGHTVDILTHAELLVGQGQSFVDEGTTQDEDDLIVGMYKVHTDNGNTQTADCSWWPRQHTWTHSSFCAGYWTPKAESWFQAHLSNILAGKSQVRSASVWKEALKRNKQSSIVFQRTELASQAFIQARYH
ncbi:hypothetical protein K474DRAFT_1714330 [Panus rudis PR-1116 ss-1]|nr:hypothetical protein K474DRAFT_1714330 [Panus rudis PR-1116 ss-1]